MSTNFPRRFCSRTRIGFTSLLLVVGITVIGAASQAIEGGGATRAMDMQLSDNQGK
jgi:hypothetical protein